MDSENGIQPYTQDQRYWQYRGEPVLLLGGSATDHLFLLDGLEAHLDEIAAVGGNYVRNTMSQREDVEHKAHRLRPDGTFDLERWNADYWERFDRMLHWTAERDIVVQIEVWDRFDYSQDNWQHSPWNPGNNVNYTYEETGFAPEYPLHPGRDVHPFFHTIPDMNEYRPQYDLIRDYQERFVTRMLSYSLPHGHVLYCMDNETSTDPAWGQHWIRFIQKWAKEVGTSVYTTDMFDDIWKAEDSVHCPVLFEQPDLYTFVDISQVNSRNFHEIHWVRGQWLLEQVREHPRPTNNTKIYGSGHTLWGSGGPEDGVERFWRDIIGGCASARFHRPGAGNGLNARARASIRAARRLQTLIEMWEVEPRVDLLANRRDEVYVAADPGRAYVLYYADGGTVGLDLTEHRGRFSVRWIDVGRGAWDAEDVLHGGDVVTLPAPGAGGWLAAVVR
ncbi:MAG: hypothetical protein ACLFV5_07525, partial [Anaerolineales bacterium]